MKKYSKLGSAALAACSVVTTLAPMVGAEEVKDQAVVAKKDVKAEEQKAQVVKAELVNKDASLGDKYKMGSPVTLRTAINLGDNAKEVRDGKVTLSLGDGFDFFKHTEKDKDGKEVSKTSKIRVLKGDKVFREINAEKLFVEGNKDEVKKADAAKPAEEMKKDEVKKAEETKADATTEAKKAEASKNPFVAAFEANKEVNERAFGVKANEEKAEATTEAKKAEDAKADEAKKAEEMKKDEVNTAKLELTNKGMLQVEFAISDKDIEKGMITVELDLVPRIADQEDREIKVSFETGKTKEEAVVKAHFDKAEYVTRYLDLEGNILAPEKKAKDRYAKEEKIAGYVLRKYYEEGSVRTYLYRKVETAMTRYVDADGKEIKEAEKGAGQQTAIEGYVFDHAQIEDNGDLTYHYVKAVYTHFVDEEGKELLASVAGKEAAEPAEIEGYAMAEKKADGQNVTYVYKKAEAGANAAAADGDGKKALPKTGTASVLGTMLAGVTALGGGAAALFKRRKK